MGEKFDEGVTFFQPYDSVGPINVADGIPSTAYSAIYASAKKTLPDEKDEIKLDFNNDFSKTVDKVGEEVVHIAQSVTNIAG